MVEAFATFIVTVAAILFAIALTGGGFKIKPPLGVSEIEVLKVGARGQWICGIGAAGIVVVVVFLLTSHVLGLKPVVIAQASPQPSPSTEASNAERKIISTVEEYYDNLNTENYQQSYQMLSASAQLDKGFDDYKADFQTLVKIEIYQLRLMSLSNDKATVQLQSVTTSWSQGLYRQRWQITWELIREDGEWRCAVLYQTPLSDPTPVSS